jgi:ATP synthase protein I
MTMRIQLRGAEVARAVCLVQVAILVVAAALAAWIWGRPQAVAAVYGGLVAVVPTIYFALRVFARRTTQDPKQAVTALYVGEIGKLVLTALLFWIGVVLFAKQFLALMVTYAACLLAYWLVLAWLGFDWTGKAT